MDKVPVVCVAKGEKNITQINKENFKKYIVICDLILTIKNIF